jgi:hypothetical protein
LRQDKQRLRDQRFQTSMRLLGHTIFMRLARCNPARSQPVVLEHGAEARCQIAPTTGFQLVRRSREVVAAQHRGGAAERPQRTLDPCHERLEGFPERHCHPCPMAVAEDELKQQVRQGLAGDRHAQVGPVREIDRRFATRYGDLLEEHLGLDTVARPPVAKPPLQRPRLARLKLLGIALAQHLQHHFGLEDALEVAPQQRLHVRLPHRRKRIRTGPPIPGLFRRRRHGTAVPFSRGAQTHTARGRRGCLCFAIHTCLPHQPNLRIRDH